MAKVRIQVSHPEFKADTILPEGKALTYLKRLKKTFKDNLSVISTVVTKEDVSKFVPDISGPMPSLVTKEQRKENVKNYESEMRKKGFDGYSPKKSYVYR